MGRKNNKYKKQGDAPEKPETAAVAAQPPASTLPSPAAAPGQPVPATPQSAPAPAPSTSTAVAKPPPTSVVRKAPGTAGRRFTIESNYVALDLSRLLKKAYHYDVTIDPDRPKKLMPTVFTKFMEVNFKNCIMAYDGARNAYSTQKLDLSKAKTCEISIQDEGSSRQKNYKVQIQETKSLEIDLSVLKNYQNLENAESVKRALQCIDVIMRTAFMKMTGVKMRNALYLPPKMKGNNFMPEGYELWAGLFQSVLLCKYPMLNIDVIYKGFPREMGVIDIIMELIPRANLNAGLNDFQKGELHNFLNGLSVIYTRPSSQGSWMTYKYLKCMNTSALQGFSIDVAGPSGDKKQKKTTVAKYFEELGCKLRYPNLPCLHVGNPAKGIFIPVEFLRVPGGQATLKKYSPGQTKFMVNYCSCDAPERQRRIMEEFNKLEHNKTPCIDKFGIKVGSKFEKVPARVISTPVLDYGKKYTLQPLGGEWRPDRERFKIPVRINHWGILVLDRRAAAREVVDFGATLENQLNMKGVEVTARPQIDHVDGNRRDINAFLTTYMKEAVAHKCQILIVIIQTDLYEIVKKIAEIDVGCLTQCVESRTIRPGPRLMSSAANIAMKVNAKLAGVNHLIHEDDRLPQLKRFAYMLMGADVTHPSPDQRSLPSIVGFTASFKINDEFKHRSDIRFQDSKLEIIQDLETLVYDQILFYNRENKKAPTIIFYYRDGVSDGQFLEVKQTELQAIRRACHRINANWKPHITFVVVQKRHHTRFFPGDSPICGRDRQKNVPPGTVIDEHIVQPFEPQFFMVSHLSPLGVARPTKYCIIHDDSNFTMDELQKLTYALCHMCTRCNRSISYPAPTYYAHLMAARGRAYIRHEVQGKSVAELNRLYTIHKNISQQNPMFFV